MAITYEENRAIFESVIYEDEVVSFRDFLQGTSPDEVKLDFNGCEDVHLAVLQLVMAYKKKLSNFLWIWRYKKTISTSFRRVWH